MSKVAPGMTLYLRVTLWSLYYAITIQFSCPPSLTMNVCSLLPSSIPETYATTILINVTIFNWVKALLVLYSYIHVMCLRRYRILWPTLEQLERSQKCDFRLIWSSWAPNPKSSKVTLSTDFCQDFLTSDWLEDLHFSSTLADFSQLWNPLLSYKDISISDAGVIQMAVSTVSNSLPPTMEYFLVHRSLISIGWELQWGVANTS